MRITKKIINGFEMTGYNDSNCVWVILSKDKDGSQRTQRYALSKFTLTAAFQLHAQCYGKL